MNPIASLLNPLERLITEHGSAAIQTKHIALLKEQFSILEKENAELKSKISVCEKEKQVLESGTQNLILENENLRAIIKEYEQSHHNLKNDPPEPYDPLTYGFK